MLHGMEPQCSPLSPAEGWGPSAALSPLQTPPELPLDVTNTDFVTSLTPPPTAIRFSVTHAMYVIHLCPLVPSPVTLQQPLFATPASLDTNIKALISWGWFVINTTFYSIRLCPQLLSKHCREWFDFLFGKEGSARADPSLPAQRERCRSGQTLQNSTYKLQQHHFGPCEPSFLEHKAGEGQCPALLCLGWVWGTLSCVQGTAAQGE